VLINEHEPLLCMLSTSRVSKWPLAVAVFTPVTGLFIDMLPAGCFQVEPAGATHTHTILVSGLDADSLVNATVSSVLD